MAGNSAERATERVAVLMTPSEKAVYVDRASGMGLSLGQFFREAGAAYVRRDSSDQGRREALDTALTQLELSTQRAEQALDQALALVHRAVASSGPALESDTSGSR